MSLKKNIGVLVLLLVLLSMSAVSAEDVSINADDTYQTPNEIQKDFTSLQTDIDNSQNVFELTYDVKHGDDEIDNYGISITKNTIINGNGHTIDANGHGSIFVVKDSSVTLALNDLTLINANPVSDSSGIVSNGGAVYFDGSTLIVNNVNFKNNTVYKCGGAIYTTGTCIVDSSVFDGNDVQFRSQNIGNGGAAIYADNGASLLISNSQIINNHKNMVIRDNNVGDLVDGVVVATGYTKISKSYFRNNSGCYGGAVTSLGYTNAGKNQIIIENSVFDSNRAFQGAAVNVIGSTFKISGTNFTNNKGVGYGSGNPNVGALLTWYGCEGTISDCNFINNTADNGAAYELGDDNNGVSSASVDSCTFINNTASNQGGAVYEGGKTGKATLDIKNSTFTNNSAKKEGSAIYSGYTLNIDDDTTFTNNMVYMYYTGTLNIGEIKTFTDLQKAINMVEGDIYLSSNVTMLASEADNFVNGIVVDHLVNLKCDGFTINANNLGRIFNVTSTADKLNIYNANLINGNADIGGAIYNTGSVYAYNTNFINNTAATMGGAVFNNGELVVSDSVFDSNDIVNRGSASVDYGGAAIYNWKEGTLKVTNSNFTNNIKNYKNGDNLVGAITTIGNATVSGSNFVNNSGRWGGAISATGAELRKNSSTLTVSNTIFKDNSALYAGAVYIWGSNYNIADCVFDNNTAFGKGNMTPNNNNGGALVVSQVSRFNEPITGTISGSKFTNNKAQYGGAAYFNKGFVTITDSVFENNIATAEGGAVGFSHASVKDLVVSINNSSFVGNKAPVAGAIFTNVDSKITNSNFINNSAAKIGGAICNVNDLTVENSKFVNNTPQAIHNSKELHLGIETFTDLQNAIDLVTGTLTLNQNVVMTDDEAANFVNGVIINKNIRIDGKGHTIDAKNLGRIFEIDGGFAVTLTNVTLTNGKADNGGAIYNFGNLDLVHVNFVNNTAKYGGAIMNYAYGLVLDDSTFTNNTAKIGGAIYNSADCFVVGNSTFANNTATSNGGVIFNYGIGFVVGNSTFVNNSAADGAGAILNGGRGFVVGNSTFANNTATSKGGAIYNYGIGFVVGNSTFANNTAEDAGAVYNEGDNSVVGNSTFVNNTATSIGGAIINNGKLVVDNSAFEDNAANYYGGAIFNWDDLQVTNSAFDGNDILVRNIRAMDNVDHGGAAIYNWKNGKLDISKSNFTNNIKNYKNGNLLVGAVATIGDATISDSYFVNNSGRWGGALSVMGGESSSATNFIDIDGTKFVNNSALYGGAMFVWGSNYSISNSVFDNNSAFGKGNMTPNNNNGGALVVTQGNIPISGTIINSNFTNNKAQYGGAAWINEGTVDISNSNFINNTATVKAGAIGFEPAYTKITATVYGTNFINNTAGVDGGAIYSSGDLRISDSDFDNNKAQKADIIYSNINGLLSINGNNYSNYTENKAPIINLAGIETISSDGGVIITVLDNKTVNVCYGDVVTLHAIITVDGVLVANQDLSFSVYNGEDVVVCKANSLLNGSYVATYKINDVINKTVSIVYDGPEVHINTGILNVSKANPDLTVGALNITVGDLEIITVTGPKDATGLITLTLNGIDYILPIYNGEAKFYFQDLVYGTYDVSASYSGDNHYVAAENSTVFKVDKVLANLNIHVEDITFGENGLVIITLPSDIDGSIVTVNVNGKVYPVDIENGFGKLPLRELDAGDYTISAVFAGNDKYLPGVSNALLTVSKADPALNVLISDVGYDGVFNINVALTGVDAIGLNGNVIVTVNNKDYSVNIVNGKGTAVGVKLAAGTYDFTAAWAGNDNYNAVGDSGKFSVAKVDSIIDVAVSDIKVGEDAVISVKLLSDATGSVTVTVNGKDYTETVVNGVANVKVADLKAGTYDVAVKYSGDNNYNAAVATSSFTVSKVDSTMDVTVKDIVFGGDLTVDVVLPGDATGEVVITVNGVDYHVAIENGKATGTIGGLVAGDYTVTVKYAGDDKYTAVEIAKGVNVAKAQPVLGVVIADVDYGNGFVIEATLTGVNSAPLSGNVIVTVNGKEYTVKVTDGKGIATGDKLAAGTYAFAAVWAGDDNYNIVTENGDFKVNKVDSSVVVNVNDIKVGEELTITVNVPSDATGDVTVSVDGKEYKVAIENGKAVKTISGLKADDYTVTVKYAGDNNYNEANADAEFSVSKISDYNMDISVPEIKEGVNSTIGVDLPKDATGTVTVEIDGKKYTANVIDGTANVIVSGLSAGDYNITTVYSGDAKYDSMTKKGNVTVIPNINVNLDVSDVEMFYHDGTRLIAKLTDFQGKPIVNATIYFSINGVTYAKTTDANGTASMGLNLDSNVYPVTVTYNGSAFYSKISKNITVTINSSIIADDLVKMYQNATRFYAKFMGSDGKVLANTQVKFNIHGVFYTKTTNNDGVADLGIMLRPGTYILTAYNPVTGEQQGFNITVKSLIVQNDLTKYYMNASKFQATIYDKNGSLAVNKNVTFNIHGVFYTRTTDENGVVSLGISLRPGEYVITTMYEGLDLGNTVTVLPTLVTHDLNMKYMDGSNFTAQTLDGQGNPLANQNVSFNVNGVFYHKVTDDNGFASLTIRLMSGKYIITSSWNDFQTGNNITIS